MQDQITLTINGIEVAVPAGTTILKAAEQVGITDIPTLCYHEACTSNGLCRLCVVEVEGSRTLTPSCCTAVTNGMKIQTRTPRVERARRTILEMLVASVDLSDAPEVQQMIDEYSAIRQRFPDAEPGITRSWTTTRCISAITTNASSAGVVCRSVRKTRNTLMPSIFQVVVMKPASIPFSKFPC